MTAVLPKNFNEKQIYKVRGFVRAQKSNRGRGKNIQQCSNAI